MVEILKSVNSFLKKNDIENVKLKVINENDFLVTTSSGDIKGRVGTAIDNRDFYFKSG